MIITLKTIALEGHQQHCYIKIIARQATKY